jgi:hypothetical protein
MLGYFLCEAIIDMFNCNSLQLWMNSIQFNKL